MKDGDIYCCDPPAKLTRKQQAAFKRKVLRLAKPYLVLEARKPVAVTEDCGGGFKNRTRKGA